MKSTLVYDKKDEIGHFVSMGLFGEPNAFSCYTAVGIERGGRLIAGVIYNNMLEHKGIPYCIEMSIYSIDKNWATRHTLNALFTVPFTQYKLRRIQALCSANNEGVKMFLTKLGFTQEGIHRKAYHDAGDAVSFGMLRDECRWIRRAE